MRTVELELLWPGWRAGSVDVIRYKLLKTLRVSHTNLLEHSVPWGMLSRAVDRRRGVSAMPWARKR